MCLKCVRKIIFKMMELIEDKIKVEFKITIHEAIMNDRCLDIDFIIYLILFVIFLITSQNLVLYHLL